MFFAYRDFTNAADVILEELGLGRAHHRALHFIGRHPGMTVGELLSILRNHQTESGPGAERVGREELCRAGPGTAGPAAAAVVR